MAVAISLFIPLSSGERPWKIYYIVNSSGIQMTFKILLEKLAWIEIKQFLPQDTPIVLFVNQKGLAYFHAFVQYEGHFEVQVGWKMSPSLE